MSSEEKKKVLKMVEDGKISAEEARKLIKALDESSAETEIIDAPRGSQVE
jgi:polyhydroxyalkanoate synthesis regulator phasin